jgi:hypothetical protein
MIDHPLTIDELLQAPAVIGALDDAWIDSTPDDPTSRHEEGGWIYQDRTTGVISIRRAAEGGQADLDLSEPPEVLDSVIIATFHTHPNPSSEGWQTGPSSADTESAGLLGVPCLIRAEDGIHSTGPQSRRGGLIGPAGLPD